MNVMAGPKIEGQLACPQTLLLQVSLHGGLRTPQLPPKMMSADGVHNSANRAPGRKYPTMLLMIDRSISQHILILVGSTANDIIARAQFLHLHCRHCQNPLDLRDGCGMCSLLGLLL